MCHMKICLELNAIARSYYALVKTNKTSTHYLIF